MRIAVLLLMFEAVTLGGCSSDWHDATSQGRGSFRAKVDESRCLKEAQLPKMPAVSEDIDNALWRYRFCMVRKGWANDHFPELKSN